MRRYLGILLLLISCLLVAKSAEAQHDKYYFNNLIGRAVISRTAGSTWLVLQQAQPVELKPGDMVNVEGNGRGELRFPDGTIARLKNNAMVTVMRFGINLRLGNVWLTVRRSSDIFKVISPLGSCSVLGTSFDVDVDRFGKTHVRVFSGLVAIRASADARNRQLVLQPGMRTTITDNSKVADKPDKFQGSTIETSLVSEWEARKFVDQSTPPALQPALPPALQPALPPAMQPAVQPEASQLPPVVKTRTTPAKPIIPPAIRPITMEPPPIGPIGNSPGPVSSSLPPIRPELESDLILPPVNDVIQGVNLASETNGQIKIIARQRSEFLEMLRQQQLARDSVIGNSFPEKDAMIKDQHGSELGQYYRSSNNIYDNNSLDREYSLLRNRMLRVQSQIRQTELEMNALIKENIATPSQRRKISSSQALLLDLHSEQRLLSNRLRDIQTKKR